MTKDAGTAAGLDVLRIISGPAAAAIAYGLDRKGGAERNVLMFYLEAVLLICQSSLLKMELLKSNLQTSLGGENLGQPKGQPFLLSSLNRSPGSTLVRSESGPSLQTAHAWVKHTLFSNTQARIEMDSLCEEIDFHSSMTHAGFEKWDPFHGTEDPAEKALKMPN